MTSAGKVKMASHLKPARKTVTDTNAMDIHADNSKPSLVLDLFNAPLIGSGSPRLIVCMGVHMPCPVSEPIQPAPQPSTPAPNNAPNRPGIASENLPLNILIPAKIKPPKQITAPAYTANVLNVPMSVVAPEKSIVPCAFAALANASARRVGAITREAWTRDCFEKVEALRLARRFRHLTVILGRIIGYLQQRCIQLR
jgi:hypothetical protein